MDSQQSAMSYSSIVSSVDDCTLDIAQQALLDVETEYFAHWYEDSGDEEEEEEAENADLHDDGDLWLDRLGQEDEAEEPGTAAAAPDLSSDDVQQQQREENFMDTGCGCIQSCHSKFEADEIIGVRHTFLELPQQERNQLILFAIQSFCQTPKTAPVTTATKGHSSKGRQRTHSHFLFHGVEVCQTFFLFVHGITKKIFARLLNHYNNSPIEYRLVRPHGNAKKLPHNTLSVEAKQAARDFILNYATKHSIPLPGRMPTVTNFTDQQLPSDVTKVAVHREYVEGCRQSGQNPVGLTVFKELWPSNIHVMKPESDICTVCQKNNRLIFRTANQTDAVKSQRVQEQQQHLSDASKERAVFKAQCETSKGTAKKMAAEGVQPGQVEVNSKDVSVHYSVDYIQNVLLPSFAQQPASLYFKTGRKVHLFIACNEGRPHGFLYAIDEARATGKGANEVISMLHDYIATSHFGEKTMHCHADNCGGQNKNNAFIHYLMWRCMSTLNTTITYAFMMVGHTRFGPDWLAGLFKSSFRKADVQSLADVAGVADRCAAASGALKPRLVGEADSPVPTYNWQTHLQQYFKPLPGIRKYHHFRFEAGEPGIVYTKTASDGPEEKHCLLKVGPQDVQLGLPPVKPPPGLSEERQKYLYKEIRPFLDEDKKDLTAPRPPSMDAEDTDTEHPQRNKRRKQ